MGGAAAALGPWLKPVSSGGQGAGFGERGLFNLQLRDQRMLRTRSQFGLLAVVDYLADGIAFPDDADIAVLMETAGVDAYELLQGPGGDAAAGVAVRGELAGGKDGRRTGLARPGTAIDQEGGEVPPWTARPLHASITRG
jgi:hypothetical protein